MFGWGIIVIEQTVLVTSIFLPETNNKNKGTVGREVAEKFPPRNQGSVLGNASGKAYVMCQLYSEMLYIKDSAFHFL